MRILMLAQFYPPIIGGEERLVQDLSIELAQRGHQVAVATLLQGRLPAYEVDEGVEIYRLPSLGQRAGWMFAEADRRHAPPWPDPAASLGLWRVLRQHRPEVVHAHNWLLFSYLPLKVASPARFVVTLHDYSLACSKKRLMRHGKQCSGPALRKCAACASQHYGVLKGVPTFAGHWLLAPRARAAVDLFLPISQAVAQGNGLVGGRWPYQVIPNFVPDTITAPPALDPALAAQLPPDGFWLFVGDFTPDKGFDLLLRAYAGLENVPPLVVIGRRHAQQALPDQPNVVVLENWPHAAVMAAWQRCGLALMPSVWAEPFGLVALEAMAMGRPVIASNTGGVVDFVVDGVTGVLVPPGDKPALQAAMLQLHQSPELRARLGQAGQLRAAEFRASAVVPRVEEAYRAVLNNRPARLPAAKTVERSLTR